MIDFKTVIADELKKVTNIENISEYIEIPTNKEMGDYSLPCFKLAKDLKKAPQIIANEIKNTITISPDVVSKIEVVNEYLNLYLNNISLTKSN